MKNREGIAPKVQRGFSLIEMIGVMAVMAILAAVITPNIVHSIEQAAIKVEAENLRNFGTAIGSYLRDNRTLPTEGNNNWNAQIAPYASLNAAAILTNKRQVFNVPGVTSVPRVFVIDPVAANHRAMLISSMRYQVAIPPIATLHTYFSGIWNTADNAVPPGTWTGWGAGPPPALDNIEYLVIERINLTPIYNNELMSYNVTLNQLGSGTVSYKMIPISGSTVSGTLTSGGTTTATIPVYPRDRVYLYSDNNYTVLKYTYVVSNSSQTFDFTTAWAPR